MKGGSGYEILAFLDFELVPAARRLRRDGQAVAIGGRAFDLLVLLATHAGEVLSKRALMQGVWPNTVVEDVNLRAQIVNLRRVLGGGADCPWLVNVAGQGYCFTAPVRRPSTFYGDHDGWQEEEREVRAGAQRLTACSR
jgi:DNA-binding winged helix-turn-helix (wHTH) protein